MLRDAGPSSTSITILYSITKVILGQMEQNVNNLGVFHCSSLDIMLISQ
jgi:hypothetical protein